MRERARAALKWELPLERPFTGAHRGGAGLFPENTLEAFTGAAERFGCRFMELDVRATREGIPVVIHDATVDRTTDGHGAVSELSLNALQRLDAGCRFRDPEGRASSAGKGVRVPTLEAVLDALPDCVFSVEIKQQHPPCDQQVVQAIRRTGMSSRVVVGAEFHSHFLRIHALAPEVASFFSRRSMWAFVLALELGLVERYRPPHQVMSVPESYGPYRIISPRLVSAAHRKGIPVLVWTVDQPDQMRKLLALGVDGIITDRPDRLQAVLREYGR